MGTIIPSGDFPHSEVWLPSPGLPVHLQPAWPNANPEARKLSAELKSSSRCSVRKPVGKQGAELSFSAAGSGQACQGPRKERLWGEGRGEMDPEPAFGVAPGEGGFFLPAGQGLAGEDTTCADLLLPESHRTPLRKGKGISQEPFCK